MTHETKKKIKAAAYAEYRSDAVKCMMAMGVPNVEDSWEGMMKAIDYVKDHNDKDGEFSGAVMAAAKWMHGYLEEDTARRLAEAEKMVSAEVSAAKAAPTAIRTGAATM